MSDDRPSDRERFNRTMGLSAYASAIVMTGLIAFMAYDEIHSHGFKEYLEAVKKDPTSSGIVVAIAVILWAIGFTTGR